MSAQNPSNVTVVTFATCGAPQDRGLDLRAEAFAMRYLALHLGHHFALYTPASLIAAGHGDLVRAYDDKYQLPMNAGYHTCGFGAWKPFIILDTLRRSPPGHTVFYLDCNMSKYPAYREKLEAVDALLACSTMLGPFRVFRHASHSGQLAKHYSSEAQLREIGGNSEFCRNFPLLAAHNIIAVNSLEAQELTGAWLDLCRDERLLLPPQDGEHDPDFQWFCAEQSVLNQLIARRVESGQLPWNYPGLAIGRGFAPALSENSHVAYLAQSGIPTHLAALERPATSISWRPVTGSWSDWQALHGLTVQSSGSGAVEMTDAPKLDFHIWRLTDPILAGRPLMLNLRASPLPGCNTCLIVMQINGTVVAATDPAGNAIVNNAASLETCLMANGEIEISATFFNLDGSLSLGLGQPYGYYEGSGTAQYVLHGITIAVEEDEPPALPSAAI